VKTLQQFIDEVTQEQIHTCSPYCQKGGAFPKHTGGGHYDKISHIPQSLIPQIKREAKRRFDAQDPE
jgi:hypothetical protein